MVGRKSDEFVERLATRIHEMQKETLARKPQYFRMLTRARF